MATLKLISLAEEMHGKVKKRDNAYSTFRHGKQFLIGREETYQKNQSPRQKWNSAAFAYAHQQLRLIESDPTTTAQMTSDWDAANHLDAQGRLQQTAHGWKFNMLITEYKTTHPLEE